MGRRRFRRRLPSGRIDRIERGFGQARPPVREFRPGLEALRLAIHRPADVGDRLEAALFRDDLQREAFLVLADADRPSSTRSSSRPRRRSGPSWCA